ncbi:hypothetical protein [Oceanicoccus sp. KOV_DT_Chl]|uniref:hypothetical protein n=1 Tax=Oceanicoccus sp. KOV_DT_Chl TaxID=1904639 RepID=UPI000C7D3DE4|nr:hypothetical protein [Oceanicoccus sp. KOV_DT_Chl]
MKIIFDINREPLIRVVGDGGILTGIISAVMQSDKNIYQLMDKTKKYITEIFEGPSYPLDLFGRLVL